MFDRAKTLPVRLVRQDGDLRAAIHFPSDQQIMDRASARRIVITSLGRGGESYESLKPEYDIELVKSLLNDPSLDVSQREADGILSRLLGMEVVSCERSAGGFDLEFCHPSFAGSQAITVRVPTTGQLDEFERSHAPRKTLNSKQQYIQPNHSVASKIWMEIGPEIDLPINWKSIIIQAVKEKIDDLSAGFGDPT